MPQRVIDVFEMIDVHDDQRRETASPFIFFTLDYHLFHTLHQLPPVWQTCKIIVIRQIVNPCFRLLVLMERFFNRQPVDPG
ncbi:hypothetical protein D3C86_1843990 [compost metagenome]